MRLPQRREEAFARPSKHAAELQTGEMGGCDSDVRTLELTPQSFPGSRSQGGINVRQRVEDRLFKLQRAFHGIAEKHRTSVA